MVKKFRLSVTFQKRRQLYYICKVDIIIKLLTTYPPVEAGDRQLFLPTHMSFLENTPEALPSLNDRSDEEILALSVTDPEVFSVLVERYEEAFIRKATRVIFNDPETVRDIVQDTFVKIYLNAGKFKIQEGASFKSWGYKILLNTCFTKYKKLKGEKVFLSDLDPEIQELVPSKEAAVFQEQKLDTDYVLSLISRLPVILGRVLKLYSVEGKAQKEIAKREGISLGAVRARIHRAKKEIKKMRLDLL